MIFPRHAMLKGLFMILTHVVNTAISGETSGHLPDLSFVSKLFSIFMKPYLTTFNSEPVFRVNKESEVDKVIKQKIEELKPFLQDNDFDMPETDNRFTFEGKDETTIIEFVPQPENKSKTSMRGGNDTFKNNMKRYKKIRQKISIALEKENVSDDTKTLVMNTFDELISKMVETQCNWKTGEEYGMQKNKNDFHNRIIIPRTIVDTWRTEFKKFRTDFSTLFIQRAKDPMKNMDNIMSHLNSLNIVINDILNNIETFTKKYKVSCNISERNDRKTSINKQDALRNLRLNEDSHTDKETCKYFKVCSTELKRFFNDFYKSLNNTTVNVLKSYAEMFTRDVYTDTSNEKDYIVTLLFSIADIVERGIIKTFVNDTSNFNVDKQKNKKANIILISDYVRKVVNHTKEMVGRTLENKLKNVPKKVYFSVQQDLVVNLGVELGNLEVELIGKICLLFNVCNNNTKSRRRYTKKNGLNDETEIFVKVELTVADENKEKNNVLRRIPKSESSSPPDINTPTKVNLEKYANITVTRTTLAL